MSQKEWGNITWLLFHSLVEKFNEEEFPTIKNDFINFIKNTCRHLPCPICSDHAIKTLNRGYLNLIETKADMIEFLRQFHNLVNIRTDKPIAEKEFVIHNYKKTNLKNVIINFIKIYSHKYGNFDIAAFNRANQRQLYVKQSINTLNYLVKFCN